MFFVRAGYQFASNAGDSFDEIIICMDSLPGQGLIMLLMGLV